MLSITPSGQVRGEGFEPSLSGSEPGGLPLTNPRRSSSSGIRTHSIPDSESRWSASCLPSQEELSAISYQQFNAGSTSLRIQTPSSGFGDHVLTQEQTRLIFWLTADSCQLIANSGRRTRTFTVWFKARWSTVNRSPRHEKTQRLLQEAGPKLDSGAGSSCEDSYVSWLTRRSHRCWSCRCFCRRVFMMFR